jgi:hypothetical protein
MRRNRLKKMSVREFVVTGDRRGGEARGGEA